MTRFASHSLPIADRLRQALRTGGLDNLPDHDLLERFAHYAEHDAFTALLRRHGPMVFGVCRRVLINTADAEDAFQATFLVLVRKARTIRRGDQLGSWLYGVAVRVALKARSRAARLAERGTEAIDMIPDPYDPATTPEWLPILDAELNALPAKYREALVLCELRDESRAAAAKALGIPEGTLSSRLSRGRDLLRRRLLKHGTLLPAGGLTTLFTAGGIGRASVPLGLLAKTADVAAVVATGSALAGVVPAGAARLMDEVLKGMLLTKLRMASGTVLASLLVAVGVAAALPGEPAEQPKKPKVSPSAAAKPQSPKPDQKDGVVLDQEAVQGLWVFDKITAGKAAAVADVKAVESLVGNIRILVAGDVWWFMQGGAPATINRYFAKVDAGKNPKWLDLTREDPVPDPDRAQRYIERYIYELADDRLRLAMGTERRPSEFTTDDDSPLVIMEFRREPMPRPAGADAPAGSWGGPVITPRAKPDGNPLRMRTRVEILDSHFFAFIPDDSGNGKWIGGTYTTDATKNPKWIDVDLVAPFSEKVLKMYGSYELAKGELKLVLETSGRRTVRPLAFERGDDVLFFDLNQVVEEPAPPEPLPKAKQKAVPSGEKSPDNATPTDDQIQQLMIAQEYAKAETIFRERITESTGLLRATYRVWLSTCLLERASGEPGEAARFRTEAEGLLGKAIPELEECEKAGGPDNKHASAIRTQAELRLLQVLHAMNKTDELLAAVEQLWVKHRGTAEELVVSSFAYHAHKQMGKSDKAQGIRQQMKELFEKLKDKPDAFTAKTGEFSREYWEKVWFSGK